MALLVVAIDGTAGRRRRVILLRNINDGILRDAAMGRRVVELVAAAVELVAAVVELVAAAVELVQLCV